MKRFSNFISMFAAAMMCISALGWTVCLVSIGEAEEVLNINYLLVCGLALFVCLLVYILDLFGITFIDAEYIGIKKESLINFFDISCILCGTAIAFSYTGEYQIIKHTRVVIGITIAVSMLAILFERISHVKGEDSVVISGGAGGRFMLLGIFAFVIAAAGLVFGLAMSRLAGISELFARILAMILKGLKSVAVFATGILGRILEWLARILPEPEGSIEMEPVSSYSVEIPETSDYFMMPSWIFFAMGAAVALLFIVIILKNMHRSSREGSGAKRPLVVKRQSHLRSSVSKMFKSLCDELSYRWKCIRYRNTPPGKLVRIEREAPADSKRLKGESGEAFLRRLGYDELATELEKYFYACRKQ